MKIANLEVKGITCNSKEVKKDFVFVAIDEKGNKAEIPAEVRDKGLGMCKEKNCNKFATKDYNGCGHFVCDYHDEKLNNEFDNEYK